MFAGRIFAAPELVSRIGCQRGRPHRTPKLKRRWTHTPQRCRRSAQNRRLPWRSILSAALLVGILGALSEPAHARASVQVGISLPGPPQLVPIPGTVVSYAPGVHANYFFYASQYWAFAHGGWYAGSGYNGPWVLVAPAYVPRPLLVVPVRYYRLRPRGWRHWRADAPPHWSHAWGRHWVEPPRPPRVEHRERQHAEHRERPRGAHEERHRERHHGEER
jgi:hypothetical protein